MHSYGRSRSSFQVHVVSMMWMLGIVLPGIVARRPGWGVVSRLREKPTHGGLTRNCHEKNDVDDDSEMAYGCENGYLGVKVFFRFTSLGPLLASY